MIRAVIFDMDGTILNTLDDLADAINYALKSRGHKCDFTMDAVRMFFGSGIRVAFERALAMEKGCSVDELEYIGRDDYAGEYKADSSMAAEIDELMKIYMPYYKEHCNDKTSAYDGIYELLDELKDYGLRNVVVSNKPDNAVKILCEDMFAGKFDYNLGELPELRRKPFRDMIDASLTALGVSSDEAIYIGDSEIDLQTAENADMQCIAVTWGFRGRTFLEKHGAKIIIDNPHEAFRIIKQMNHTC